MYSVYVLRSLKDRKLYTGFSSDLRKRIERHNLGKVKATKNRKPFKLIYYESLTAEMEARKRERFLKTWAGRIWLQNKIRNGECSSIG
ncbi:MAG: GIY-YIG nuclease family protein [candidate division WOR-3 bacterium]|nr:GIY-YIG nuclease family protein [candidate division WOR-3 bacterium]